MKYDDIGRYRLAAQHIGSGLFDTPEQVVRHLLAMQAQDYAGALWSVGLRTKQATATDVERAIRDRTIIRTWPMRGTLHLVPADDIHWLLKLLAPRATAAAAGRRVKQLGLTDDIVSQAERVLRAALKGGKSIVRGDVVTLLNEGVKGFEISNQHTQHLMRNFGERGIICFGPHQGKQPSFVLLDDWVPPQNDKPRQAALAELAARYFAGHGPATLKDFAGWGMLTMSDAKAGLASAESQLGTAIINDVEYYFDRSVQADRGAHTYLLPGFDEFLLGYKDRAAVLAGQYANRIVPGGNGMFLATVVQDGRVRGLWKRKPLKSGMTFQYESLGATISVPSAAEDRYAAFMESAVRR